MRNGLSTATAVDGALRGAQQMSGLIDSHKRRGLMDAEAQRSQEHHDSQMASADQDRNFQQEKMQDYRSERRKQQEEEAERALIRSGYARANSVARGDMSKEDLELIERYPLADVEYLQSEEMGRALGTLKSVMAGETKLPYNEKGAIDLSQSPELQDALMALDPNLVRGNKDGKKVRPHFLIPSEDGKTMRVGLDVDGDDKVRPLTVNRSSADDDPVMEIRTADLVEAIMGAERARELTAQPEFYQYLMEAEGMTEPMQATQAGFSEPFKHEELGWVQRGADGKMNPINSGAGGQAAAGAGGQEPADIRSARILQAELQGEGQELSFEQAYERVKTAAQNPTRYIGDYVKSRVEAQKFMGADQRQSIEEIERDAIASYQRIQQSLTGGREAQPASSGQQPATQQRQAPPAAIERLKADLQAGDHAALQEFEEYFGYAPEGL